MEFVAFLPQRFRGVCFREVVAWSHLCTVVLFVSEYAASVGAAIQPLAATHRQCVFMVRRYGSSSGGVAYVGSFAKYSGYYSPAFIFATSLSNSTKYVWEAASHGRVEEGREEGMGGSIHSTVTQHLQCTCNDAVSTRYRAPVLSPPSPPPSIHTEIGHTLGLNHDGVTGGSAYYSGSSNKLWAPIMGESTNA